MKRWSAMILIGDTTLEGMENFEAEDIVQASKMALQTAAVLGGRVVRVESSDFGAFEFMR